MGKESEKGCIYTYTLGFPVGSDSKESSCSVEDLGLMPWLGRSPGKGNSYPLQSSCLENSMDRGAWWATVHRVTKSQTWLSDFHFPFHYTCTYAYICFNHWVTGEAHMCVCMCVCIYIYIYIYMFSSVAQSYLTLQLHELQHARLPCPSPTPGAYSNSHPSHQWCHPTISSSVIPFSSCPQSFPASGSFPMSRFFESGGQSIGVSALISVLPMNIQDWFPLGWTGWVSLQSKGPWRVFSSTTVQKHQFFHTQLSL